MAHFLPTRIEIVRPDASRALRYKPDAYPTVVDCPIAGHAGVAQIRSNFLQEILEPLQ
jgi:hypothetical protein